MRRHEIESASSTPASPTGGQLSLTPRGQLSLAAGAERRKASDDASSTTSRTTPQGPSSVDERRVVEDLADTKPRTVAEDLYETRTLLLQGRGCRDTFGFSTRRDAWRSPRGFLGGVAAAIPPAAARQGSRRHSRS